MWSKLGIRVLSGVIGAAGVLAIILFASPMWFNLVVSVACIISLYELCKTFKLLEKKPISVLVFVFALLLLCAVFMGFSRDFLTLILVSYLMLLLICAIFWNGKIKFSDVCTAFFALIYAVLLLYHIGFIRSMQNGVVLLFIPFLGAWMPDTFAYFSGTLFGKHKLIPSVSPKKTVEGAIGAVIGCIISFFVYGLIVDYAVGLSVNYLTLVILAALCGVVAQLGDLSASVIKREFGVKDFGNLIPGHGGIIDRIDSLIFIAPLVYYFLLYIPVIS